jgi:seryl-tRNA synthetase
VHQFEKVEMFTFCKPEDAQEEHKRLLAWEKEFFNSLEIPYRVIDVASGDLGASAVRKFDIEAWVPTQGEYREVTSTSNCTQYQARRLNIRYKENGVTAPVATLNGTLVAVPRTIVALLENHQQKDGSVKVPKALVPFLGMDILAPASE